jgi:ribosome-associated protein
MLDVSALRIGSSQEPAHGKGHRIFRDSYRRFTACAGERFCFVFVGNLRYGIIFDRNPELRRTPILKTYNNGPQSPEMLKALIENSLDADKAEDITTLDLRDQTAIADYMIVASGRSSRQVVALAQKLEERLSALGLKNVTIEGAEEGNWVVVDAGDIMVHLFRPEVREFYNIEKLWQLPAGMMEARGKAKGLTAV